MIAQLYAHGEQQVTNIWTSWSLDPSVLVFLCLSFFYVRGVKKYIHKKNSPYSFWRLLCFAGSFVTLIIALTSPIDYLAGRYFSAHMVQHLLVIMITAPLFLLSIPFLPMVHGLYKTLPPSIHWIKWKPYRKTISFLTHPLVSVIVFIVVYWMWHFPYFYNLALQNTIIHYLQHFSFFIIGIIIWWSLIDPLPFRASLHFLARALWITFITIQNSILSALFVFSKNHFYAYQIEQNNIFNLREDQIIGGLIMWLSVSMMMITTIGIIFYFSYKKSLS